MSIVKANRRQALGTLAALPLLSRAGAARPRVGIVGAGMAGMACAWLLDGACDVVLFESGATVGGNVRTVSVDLQGQAFEVDLGAQYFNPGPYPNYVALLSQLGLYPAATGGCRSFATSITVFDPAEPTPRFVSPMFPGRAWPLLAPWDRDGIQAFDRAFSAARRREERDASWTVSLGEWLPTLGLGEAQWHGMLLPWAASLHHGDIEAAREISARAAMVFAAKALPEKKTDPLLYYVLEGGMVEPLNRMAAQFTTVQLHTAAAVTGVQRMAGGGFGIYAADGSTAVVDQLVFATPAEATLPLVAGLSGTSVQQAALKAIDYFDTTIALHADPLYAPADPRLQSFLNCELEGAFCESSMRLSEVLGAPVPLWKSWVTHRTQLPAQVLAQTQFRHVLSSARTIRAQRSLLARQGEGGVWFAGGWTQPFDSQETALLSAMDVAAGMGVSGRHRLGA